MSDTRASSSQQTEKNVLRVAFITLFLDLIGFSIIFPLFPSMLQYYGAVEHGRGAFGLMERIAAGIATYSAATNPASTIVLFGGLLGSLYSLLQFVCAPVLGSLSDRYGRKPILLLSVAGTGLSYIVWIVAGQFWLLVLSRFIGGIMSGNIATASAIVADVTDEKNRSKGMAIIGVAFGLGFIGGPVLGGIASTVNLTQHFPSLAPYGVNPFSFPALIALGLTVINLAFVALAFPETLSARRQTTASVQRTINPLQLFSPQPIPGITRTNISYFLFLVAFSGMEFSLTFLAQERFNYTAMKTGFMLLYVGIVLAMVQGSYVRKYSSVIGVKNMSAHGLVTVVPGLVLVGFAPTTWVLYLGLFFMALGSAQIIPCLTTMASLYAPADSQGRLLGVFRSLGALGRALGPLVACLMYWRLGASSAYYIAALFMVIPLTLVLSLPSPRAYSA